MAEFDKLKIRMCTSIDTPICSSRYSYAPDTPIVNCHRITKVYWCNLVLSKQPVKLKTTLNYKDLQKRRFDLSYD